AVEQHRDRKLELVEELEQPPDSDAVAVLAPAPVVRVGMRQARRVGEAEAAVVGEGLEVQAQVEGEPLAARPAELRPVDDRRIVEVRLPRERHARSRLALSRMCCGVADTTLPYAGVKLPPTMYWMNSGLMPLNSRRIFACTSMSAHSPISQKRVGSFTSCTSAPSFTWAADLCMG